MLQIRKTKEANQNFKFSWVKGNQSLTTYDQDPSTRLNNKCYEIANEERIHKRIKTNFQQMKLRALLQNNKNALLGSA